MFIGCSEKRPHSRNARAVQRDEGRETTKKGVGKRNGAGETGPPRSRETRSETGSGKADRRRTHEEREIAKGAISMVSREEVATPGL